MIKYEVCKDDFSVLKSKIIDNKMSNDEIEKYYFSAPGDKFQEVVETFDTLEEAKEYVKNTEVSTYTEQHYCDSRTYYHFDILFIEENEYDKDNEYIEQNSILVTKIEIPEIIECYRLLDKYGIDETELKENVEWYSIDELENECIELTKKYSLLDKYNLDERDIDYALNYYSLEELENECKKINEEKEEKEQEENKIKKSKPKQYVR